MGHVRAATLLPTFQFLLKCVTRNTYQPLVLDNCSEGHTAEHRMMKKRNGRSSTETFQFHRRTLQYLKLKFLDCWFFIGEGTNEKQFVRSLKSFMRQSVTEIPYSHFLFGFFFAFQHQTYQAPSYATHCVLSKLGF